MLVPVVCGLCAFWLIAWFSAWTNGRLSGEHDFLLQRFVYGIVAIGGFALFRGLARLLKLRDHAAMFRPVRGALAGLVAGMCLYGLLRILLAYFVSERTDFHKSSIMINLEANRAMVLLLSGVITPVMEELLYRAGLQRYLQRCLPAGVAIGVSALCFALVHNLPGALLMFPFAITVGVLYWRWGLLSSTLAHIAYNSLILVTAS